jgi:hypothetical protein
MTKLTANARRPPPQAGRNVSLVYSALGLLAIFYYLQFFIDRYIDDAYITLSYAATLARSGVWGMSPDLVSNAATSPLNVILLALTIRLVRNSMLALYLFNIFTTLLIYFNLRYFSVKSFGGQAFAILTTALLVTNPLLTSTQGLESYLLIGLTLLACQLWDRQSYRLLGLSLSALFLTRPDALVVAFVMILLLFGRKRWNDGLQTLGFFLAPTLPWLIFAWYHLGSFFPDTLLIKRGEASWGGYTFLRGPLFYWERCRIPVLLSVILAPGLIFLGNIRNSRRSLLLGLGSYAVIHFAFYSALHVPPYHWYYAIEISTIVVLGAAGLYAASPKFQPTTIFFLILVILFSAIVSLRPVLTDGIPAIATNWGTAQQYKQIALWINRNIPDKRIRLDGEIGTVQYYTDADMIDYFTDRSPILNTLGKPHSALADLLLRFNYRHLHTEDFSAIQYELRRCKAGSATEMTWTTSTPFNGTKDWCFSKLPHVSSPP